MDLSLSTKSCGVTIQMKTLRQYFWIVAFVFSIFYKNKFGIFLQFCFFALSGVKGLKEYV